jgi:hypothetical protein
MKKLDLTSKLVRANEFTANAQQHVDLAEKHNFNAFVALTKSAEHIGNLHVLTAK